MPLVLAAVALLGLAIGSFLNVVIYRLPAHKSLSTPSSQCPACATPIRNRHNIPVLGWLLLRGRCAECSERISIRYPLIELATGLLFVAVTLRLHQLHQLPLMPAFLYFAAIGIALSMIDLDHHRLPNSIVLPSYPVLALLITVASVVQDRPIALLHMLIGAAALYCIYYLLAWSYPAGMGFGDVKLAGIVGGLLGSLSYSAVLVGAFAAFLIGGVVGALLIATRRRSRKSAMPFGPFMVLGALVALFFGGPLADMYLRVALPT